MQRFRQGGFGNGFVGWLFIEHLQEAGDIDRPVLFGEHLKPMVGNDVGVVYNFNNLLP